MRARNISMIIKSRGRGTGNKSGAISRNEEQNGRDYRALSFIDRLVPRISKRQPLSHRGCKINFIVIVFFFREHLKRERFLSMTPHSKENECGLRQAVLKN
jgi:hypothetical protein